MIFTHITEKCNLKYVDFETCYTDVEITKLGKIIFDSSLDETNLCKLGRKFNTNKSGINLDGHRSGYTSLYNLLFYHLINKNCSVAEIGIEKNALSINTSNEIRFYQTIAFLKYDN